MSLEHIIFKAFFGEPLIGIHPGDCEERVALIDRPFYEGILRLQIENIKLVDPRRHDEQGQPSDFLRRWLVLDQLHELVLVDDFSWSRCDVFAEAESLHVSHRDRKPTIAAFQIDEKILQTT